MRLGCYFSRRGLSEANSEENLSASTPALVIDTDDLSKAEKEEFWVELERKGFRSTIESRELFGYLQTLECTPELRTKSHTPFKG